MDRLSVGADMTLSPWSDFYLPDSIPFTTYQVGVKEEQHNEPTHTWSACRRDSLTDDDDFMNSDFLPLLPQFPESQNCSLDDLMTIEPFSPKKEKECNGDVNQDVFTFEACDNEPTSTATEQPQEASEPASPNDHNRAARGRRRRKCLPPEEKKRRRREQNRLAAQRSRERKRVLNARTSSEFHKLIAGNSQMQQEIEALRVEKEKLEQLLSQHTMICPLGF